MKPGDILIEGRNFTAFRNILQEAVRTRRPEILRMLQTTNPIAEDFHHIFGSFSTSRNGDFYTEIQRDDEQGVGIANLDTSQISSLLFVLSTKRLESDHINGYDIAETMVPASKSIMLGPGSKLQVRTGFSNRILSQHSISRKCGKRINCTFSFSVSSSISR
jgi:hypothetical protein